MKTVPRGASITLKVLHYNTDGDLANADSVTASVEDSSGQLAVDGTAVSPDPTGTYEYDYAVSASGVRGVYTGEFKITVGSYISKPQIKFEVIEEVA